MDSLEPIKDLLEPITLEEINSLKDSLKLMKRVDTKFAFSAEKLLPFMKRLPEHYKILEIDGKRVFSYKNLYFDTDQFHCYRKHLNGKLGRVKMRFREYMDSNLRFWEIKFKSNKGQTKKTRSKQPSIQTVLSKGLIEETGKQIPLDFGIDLESLQPKLWITFSRLTLANQELEERITIDQNITYRNQAGNKKHLTGIVVAELKQEKRRLSSPFAIAAKMEKIYPTRFSKYCTGVALLEDPIKINRFKPRLLQLEKLSGGKLTCLSKP